MGTTGAICPPNSPELCGQESSSLVTLKRKSLQILYLLNFSCSVLGGVAFPAKAACARVRPDGVPCKFS